MGWFGPSGACGCCPAIDCETLDCTDYILATCQCVDYQTGNIRTLTDVAWHLSGSSSGGPTPVIGGLASITLPPISYAGTYTFPAFAFGAFCSAETDDIFFLDKTFIGTDSGIDWWALLYVDKGSNSAPTRAAVNGVAAWTAIGVEPNAKRGGAANWNGALMFESIQLNQDSKICLGGTCLCQRDDVNLQAIDPIGTAGYGITGANSPSGYAEWIYA